MKGILLLFALTSLKLSYSQDSIVGIYRLATSLASEKRDETILQLNCDHSYRKSDSIITTRGKWELKDNDIFILYIDTMSSTGRIETPNVKVYYKLINRKLVLHEKEYSKKAFKKFIKEANNDKSNARFKLSCSDAFYEKYRTSSLNLYFEKKETFLCK